MPSVPRRPVCRYESAQGPRTRSARRRTLRPAPWHFFCGAHDLQLKDILRLERLQGETGQELLRLWAAYHDQKGGFVAGGFSGAMYRTLRKRLAECPHVRRSRRCRLAHWGASAELTPMRRRAPRPGPPAPTQFVFPMPRQDGNEIYYGQFSQSQMGFTSLVEFQARRDSAAPHLILELYPDLLETKVSALLARHIRCPSVRG